MNNPKPNPQEIPVVRRGYDQETVDGLIEAYERHIAAFTEEQNHLNRSLTETRNSLGEREGDMTRLTRRIKEAEQTILDLAAQQAGGADRQSPGPSQSDGEDPGRQPDRRGARPRPGRPGPGARRVDGRLGTIGRRPAVGQANDKAFTTAGEYPSPAVRVNTGLAGGRAPASSASATRSSQSSTAVNP